MSKPSLRDIFRLHKQVGTVQFPEVVRESSGFEVIPIDDDRDEDKELLRHLTFALAGFKSLAEKSGMRFTAPRINDVGKKFEAVIKGELAKTPIEITRLAASGYPDYEIKQGDRLTYLEMKSTGSLKAATSTFRTFYFSSGTKLKGDARHLLVVFHMQEESNKSWKVLTWELHDLANLEMQLKTEFNAGFKHLLKTRLLDSSELPHTKKPKGEQLKLT